MSASSNNPWYAATMFLSGLIAGYVVASALGGGPLKGPAAPPQVAQQPNAPAAPTPTPEPPPAEDVPEVTDEDHVRGNRNAKISVIEYSDFECPFCKRHHPTMQKVVDTYGDDVNWVYRHFPLSLHQNAMTSAVASECADEVGGNDAFWKFTDELIKTDTYDFEQIAADIGLDTAKFKACLDDNDYEQQISDEADAGGSAGVGGTPGNFILNNETGDAVAISGAVPFASFKTQIDKMLQ
jgi:protein-disulfide isomerase